MPKIYLYAEILTHIRQLSLHASLQTAKSEGTKVDVSTDKKVITVEHDGETQRLFLPTQISGTAQVIFPVLKETEISARVQIDDEHEWKCNINNEIEAPWMAENLSKDTMIQCCKCHAVILPNGKVREWKDLPSENWAELMDFWFCHKPHEEKQNDRPHAARAKGFSPQSKLPITPGIGMTDLTSIVLHEDDCHNVKSEDSEDSTKTVALRCDFCDSLVGTAKPVENLARLSKSSISINKPGSSSIFQSYPASVYICAQVLSLIEATALKRFVVHSTLYDNDINSQDAQFQPLILWIFNPDIYYSCSAYDGSGILPDITSTASLRQESHATDNTSQIYGNSAMKLPHRSVTQVNRNEESDDTFGPADLEPLQHSRHTDHRNPNRDDISQVYGESQGPQVLSGELQFEIPMPGRHPKMTADSALPYVEPMEDTETPLISDKSTATAKIIAQPSSDPDTRASSSSSEHINLVHRAAKVFYRPLPEGKTVASFLDANSTTHEELHLSSPSEMAGLHKTLEDSNAMLPTSAKIFQDWKVGLLNRYEKKPSGLSVMQENPLARGIKAKDGRVTRWSIGDGAEGLFA